MGGEVRGTFGLVYCDEDIFWGLGHFQDKAPGLISKKRGLIPEPFSALHHATT